MPAGGGASPPPAPPRPFCPRTCSVEAEEEDSRARRGTATASVASRAHEPGANPPAHTRPLFGLFGVPLLASALAAAPALGAAWPNDACARSAGRHRSVSHSASTSWSGGRSAGLAQDRHTRAKQLARYSADALRSCAGGDSRAWAASSATTSLASAPSTLAATSPAFGRAKPKAKGTWPKLSVHLSAYAMESAG